MNVKSGYLVVLVFLLIAMASCIAYLFKSQVDRDKRASDFITQRAHQRQAAADKQRQRAIEMSKPMQHPDGAIDSMPGWDQPYSDKTVRHVRP